jgi:hypothetical protein
VNAEYLDDLHREVREELVRVDGKLSILLATFGIAVSLVAGALLTGDADPAGLPSPWHAVFWTAAVLALAAIALLVIALSPTTRNRSPRGRLGYFGHVAAYDDVEEFRTALEQLEHGRADRSLEQTHALSRIVRRKYRMATGGIIVYGTAVALAVAAAAFGSG